MTNPMIKSGFIAIVGKPNVGKSTLLNAIMGEKIAIISPKPQTTRNRILGIKTTDAYQMVFIDTPGMHKGKDLLNQSIDRIAVSSLSEVDVVVFVVDRIMDQETEPIIHYFKGLKVPILLVINKIDALKTRSAIDEIILSYLPTFSFDAVIPVSAKNQTHLDKLLDAIVPHLIEGPYFFPKEMKSDQSEQHMMAELIREKILYQTEQEVPHAVAVTIESISENEALNTVDVSALIVVERPTQKQILIGKGGEKIKKIGTEARLEINRLLNTKIHLSLWVKVKKNWRNRPTDLKALGYGE